MYHVIVNWDYVAIALALTALVSGIMLGIIMDSEINDLRWKVKRADRAAHHYHEAYKAVTEAQPLTPYDINNSGLFTAPDPSR